MSRPARGQLSLDEERDELVQAALLQLVSYFSNKLEEDEMMRNQLIFIAHQFGAGPKFLSRASDLSAARIHGIIKEMKETDLPQVGELVARANQLIQQGGRR